MLTTMVELMEQVFALSQTSASFMRQNWYVFGDVQTAKI